ncbi:MAG TPA: hypothetical protein DHW50_01890 [Akkermansia sp.]|uniref:Uncharacterized protein n=1 Tax=Akkermansia massiliensis TaxID=2927224 RepID=A0AAE7BI09_9BACT|nr:hypothetical protein CXU18_03810 [Akkermansia muciniphila]QHV63985.1 hypothetical protein DMI76_11690 [Akkermansia massiliensis]HCL32394.1 hypothetical protein [Akkermansia sp.]PNC32100.1 hypothetical protein CXU17_01105 [Akkermansia muciniphila]PNC49509.1 hypothetical protein CXU11_04850 [Akkermansia muciniphila]
MWGSLFHAEKGLFPLLKKRRVPGRKSTEQQQDICSSPGGTARSKRKEKKGDILRPPCGQVLNSF